MTVKECYEAMHANYEDAKSRLMTDKLIEKFMLKFPQDPTMQQLEAALQEQNYDDAFRAAHTLKGVAANLGLSSLQESASTLTEALRSNRTQPEADLVQKVTEDYARILEVLGAYQK